MKLLPLDCRFKTSHVEVPSVEFSVQASLEDLQDHGLHCNEDCR
jgi:hypothetical protein